jgi:hypothetical protein
MRLPTTAAFALLALPFLAPTPLAGGGDPRPVRFVRIELQGEKRVLSLAEVEVIRNGRQIGTVGIATQSSDHGGASASRAADGNTDGTYSNGSVTHTVEGPDPWWELDLGEAQPIDRLVIWNRTDCCGDRLEGFTVRLLDGSRRDVWSRRELPAPHPRMDLVPWDPAPLKVGPTLEERGKLQPGIDAAIERGVQFLLTRQLRDGSFAAHSQLFRGGTTGLAVYTLLKCGVPKSHPAVQRGVRYLLLHPPDETYAISAALMAYGAYDDPELQQEMQALLDLLVSYQGAQSADGKRDDVWGYPKSHSHLADLSNTQYAALGLRAAHRAGLEVPDKVWRGLLEGALRYQCDAEKVDEPLYENGRTSTGRVEVAGFPYRAGGDATGSMTTAGLGVIAICEQGLGSLKTGTRREVDRAKRLGLAWLGRYFSVEKNRGHGTGWLDYYLYGLERVGALFGVDEIGGFDWYWEGAKVLLRRQEGNGSWEHNSEENTCFALLFLSRATAQRTTGIVNASAKKDGVWIAEEEAAEVRWRITGKDALTLWISGFSEAALHDFGWTEGNVRGLRVLSVDYLVDGEVVATVPGDTGTGWTSERYPARHTFDRRGTYRCEVRVHVSDPDAQTIDEASAELWGDALVVEVDEVLEPWMLEYPRHGAENLLRRTTVTATATSRNQDGQGAPKVLDGLHGTYWIAGRHEENPTLTLVLDRPQRGNTLLLSHVNTNAFGRDDHDRATRVRVRINGKDSTTFELDLPDRDEEKGVLRLEKSASLRKLEITVLARTKGDRWPGAVGFAEVEWLMER